MNIHSPFFNKKTWIKGLKLLCCGWLCSVLVSVVFLVSTLQFLALLLSGSIYPPLQELADMLHRYFSELIGFLTFRTDTPPFPFS